MNVHSKSNAKFFKFALFVNLLLLSAAILASAQTTQPKASYPQIFETVWQTVNDNFYDPNFAGVDWRAVHERYRPQVERVKDDTELLALLDRMLKELPVSHLRINAVGRQNARGIGAQLRLIEGKPVVASIPLISNARAQGVRVGDLILTPLNQVAGEPGSAATLRVQSCDGRERTLAVRREASAFPPDRPFVQWQKIEAQPGRRTGYLRITQFEESSVGQIDAAMNDLRDTTNLIIDVRDNTGGTNSFIRLVSYFVPGQQFVSGLLTRSFLNRLKGSTLDQIDLTKLPKMSGVYSLNSLLLSMALNGAIALYTEDLADKIYPGKVVILTGASTGSAAEGFVAYMKQKTKATTIGRATAGKLLTSNTFPLPNDWQLVVPIAVPISSDKKLFKDTPLAPDIEVQWKRQDICEGRDPDVSRALELFVQNQ